MSTTSIDRFKTRTNTSIKMYSEYYHKKISSSDSSIQRSITQFSKSIHKTEKEVTVLISNLIAVAKYVDEHSIVLSTSSSETSLKPNPSTKKTKVKKSDKAIQAPDLKPSRAQRIAPPTVKSEKVVRIIPPQVWLNIFSQLDEDTLIALSRTSRKHYLILNFNPSGNLDMMRTRMVKIHKSSFRSMSLTCGPSEKFLTSNPSSSQQLSNIKLIQTKMRLDPLLSETIRGIFSIERQFINTHAPMYHGMSAQSYYNIHYFQEFLSMVEDAANISRVSLVRFPRPTGPKTVDQFRKEFAPEKLGIPADSFDKDPKVGAELLSCNPQLFSNLNTAGESTWDFFTQGSSSHGLPQGERYFNWILDEHHLLQGPDNRIARDDCITKLLDISDELGSCSSFYKNQLRKIAGTYDAGDCSNQHELGVLLQILVPRELVDEVCYPCKPYGILDKEKNPLSASLDKIYKNPLSDPNLQVRILAQSLLVPQHHIKVVTHGYGEGNLEFFSADSNSLPTNIPEKNLNRMKELLTERDEILKKMRDVFMEASIKTRQKTSSSENNFKI